MPAAKRPVKQPRRVPFIHFDFGRKQPPAKLRPRELMPNLITVFLGLSCVLMGIEWFDAQAIAEAQAALARPNLTPAETTALAASLSEARAADAANDDLMNTALGALAATLITLSKRNGDK